MYKVRESKCVCVSDQKYWHAFESNKIKNWKAYGSIYMREKNIATFTMHWAQHALINKEQQQQ